MESLNIAFVSSQHPGCEDQGSPRVVSRLASSLVRRGNVVTVYYPSRPSSPAAPELWQGVHAVGVDSQGLGWFPFGPERAFSRRVARQLPRDLDVVVVNNEFGGGPVLRSVRRTRGRSPYPRTLGVEVLHGLSLRMLQLARPRRPQGMRPYLGYFADELALRDLEGGGADAADVCVVCSKAVQGEASRIYQLPRPHFRVIYNGVDPQPPRTDEDRRRAREALGLDPRAPYLLFVARDPHRKGLSVARRTVAQLRREGMPATLLNVGNDEPASEGVRSLGSVDEPRKQQLLRACDALFLPTLYEGMPVVVQEAASLGVPVVTTPQANLEVGEPGRDYVSVSPNSPEAHARALRELLSDPEQAKALGRAGRSALAGRTHDDQALEYLELFREGFSGGWGRGAPAAS